KHEIRFGGKLFTRSFNVQKIYFVVIGRENNIETKLPVSLLTYLEDETKRRFGLNRYRYTVKLNLNSLFQNKDLGKDIYDFYFDIKYEDLEEIDRVRIGNPRFRARYNLKSVRGERGNTVFAASPYYTFRHFNLSLQVDDFEMSVYKYLRSMMRWSFFIRLLH